MKFLRLIKYPGAKNTVLPEISRVFALSGSDFFVDVFGGSGTVSLNIDSPMIVYNDISYDAANLFNVLKTDGKKFRHMLLSFLEVVRNKSGSRDPRSLNRFVRERGEATLRELCGKPGDFTKAMIAFFRMSTSFGGMGETYGTRMEKSVFRNLEKTASTLGKITTKVSGWTIENIDFRDLIRKYERPGRFFYLDPPYPGKDRYDNNFSNEDFQDIKQILDSLDSKYLMTLDARDRWLKDVFGEPAFVRRYMNNNVEQNGNSTKRGVLFYTNVEGAAIKKQEK